MAIESLWWRLLEQTGDIFYVHDHDGRFVFVNPPFHGATGYSREDLEKLNARHLLSPEDYRRNQARIASAIAGAQMAYPWEMTIRRKDGSEGQVEFAAAVIEAEDGRPLVAGVARDVSARRQAEMELREAAAFQKTLAQVSLALHAAPTLEALCPMVCAQGRRLLGVSSARLFLVENARLVVVAAAGAPFLDGAEQWSLGQPSPLGDALRTQRPLLLDAGGRASEQPTVLLLPLLGRHAPIGLLGFCEPDAPGCLDARLQERAEIFAMQVAVAVENAYLLEELRRADRLKTDFLASVSHDLRTPLNVILGYTDIQLDGLLGPLTTDQRDALRRVRITTLGLAGLINATLDLNRLDAGRVPVESVPLNLEALWSELLVELEDHPDWGAVPVHWDMAGAPEVRGDPEKLKLILRNLVGNALKFTRAGAVTVSARYLPGRRRIELAVADTGGGIPAEELPHIFGMFQQGAGQARGGVGLGLYLVKRVVELLGGEISVSSEVGKGSIFRVAVPAGAVE